MSIKLNLNDFIKRKYKIKLQSWQIKVTCMIQIEGHKIRWAKYKIFYKIFVGIRKYFVNYIKTLAEGVIFYHNKKAKVLSWHVYHNNPCKCHDVTKI